MYRFRTTNRPGRRALLLLGLAVVTAGLTACDDGTGVGDPARVAVNFAVTTPTGAPAAGPAGSPSLAPSRVVGPPMELVGTNGTLTIEEIRLILAEVELDGDDDRCEDSDSDDSSSGSSSSSTDCAEFEGPPRAGVPLRTGLGGDRRPPRSHG